MKQNKQQNTGPSETYGAITKDLTFMASECQKMRKGVELCGLLAQTCPTLGTPRTVACQAPLCMGFPRQEYWSGLPFSSPGDLPNPGIELESPALEADSCTAGGFFTN